MNSVGSNPARVLIVDDNETNRAILDAILHDAGYVTLEAADGQEAIELTEKARPDLILLDVLMPGKSGHDVCEEIKRNLSTRETPIIFLSALAEPSDRIAGLERGAVDYIGKPFDPGEVLARVRTQLRIEMLRRELSNANEELRAKQMRLDEDLRAAAEIQRLLLPRERPAVDHLAIAWRFLPSAPVGGDLLQIHRLDERRIALIVADVSGHGVPAAMLTVALSQSLVPQAGLLFADSSGASKPPRICTPQEVLTRLDGEYPIERFERHFTICYLVLDVQSGRLVYARAGHPSPVVRRVDGGLEYLDIGGPMIGLSGAVPFEEGELYLAAGDRLFVFTDGLIEQSDPGRERFGLGRLREVIQNTADQPVEPACDALMGALDEFRAGTAFDDDVTLLAVEFRPEGGPNP